VVPFWEWPSDAAAQRAYLTVSTQPYTLHPTPSTPYTLDPKQVKVEEEAARAAGEDVAALGGEDIMGERKRWGERT